MSLQTPRRPPGPGLSTYSSPNLVEDVSIVVGDAVEVPGGMAGIVRFVGPVAGKAGMFAGVELTGRFASLGKNSGDAGGIRYFHTEVAGAGIFLPAHRARPLDPRTPTTPVTNTTNVSNPSKLFSQSVGPGVRPGHGGRPSIGATAKTRTVRGALSRSQMGRPGPAAMSSLNSTAGSTPRHRPRPSLSRPASRSASRLEERPGTAFEDIPLDALKAALRAKNERLAALSAEFDEHRAQFKREVDRLELASAAAEAEYGQQIAALTEELAETKAASGYEDFAEKLVAMEANIADLEDGVEQARRAEAEAKSEVEFLRGEVERTRAELRREREGHRGASTSDDRDDEIRSLREVIQKMSIEDDSDSLREQVRRLEMREADLQAEVDRLREDAKDSKEGRAEEPRPKRTEPGPLKKAAEPKQEEPTGGLVKGKDATEVYPDRWCALCEQDGHDVTDCPLEEIL